MLLKMLKVICMTITMYRREVKKENIVQKSLCILLFQYSFNMLILISRNISKKIIQKLAKEITRELKCYTTKEKNSNVKDRN